MVLCSSTTWQLCRALPDFAMSRILSPVSLWGIPEGTECSTICDWGVRVGNPSWDKPTLLSILFSFSLKNTTRIFSGWSSRIRTGVSLRDCVRNFTTNIPALPRFLFSVMRVQFFLSFFPSSSFNKFLFCFGQSTFCYLQSKNLNWHSNWLLFLQRSDPLVFREIQMLPHGSFLSLIRIYSLSLPPSHPPSLPASIPSFSWVLSFYFEPWNQSVLWLLNIATLEYPPPPTDTHSSMEFTCFWDKFEEVICDDFVSCYSVNQEMYPE